MLQTLLLFTSICLILLILHKTELNEQLKKILKK